MSFRFVFFQATPERLRPDQKLIIEAYLKFRVDTIKNALDYKTAIKAIKALTSKNLPLLASQQIKNDKVLLLIRDFRKILKHPCPQNRSKGNARAAADRAELLYGKKFHSDYFTNGLSAGWVYYYDEQATVAFEPQGILSLTRFNELDAPRVTREAVLEYLRELTREAVLELQNEQLMQAEEKEASRKSVINPELELDVGHALIATHKDKKDLFSIFYLEGIGENGRHYLDRYQVCANYRGVITVDSKSMYPVNYTAQPNTHTFKVTADQVSMLKLSIQDEVVSGAEILGISSTATAANTSSSSCSASWVAKKLKYIGVEATAELKEHAPSTSCVLM